MMNRNERPIFERLLAPYSLFLGIALGFVACCAAGSGISQYNFFENFERFHDYIHPLTGFYPTASQVRALALSEVPDDKIVVVVGGSSILYGTGQGPDLWTIKLQELLGDQYKVMNFAAPGAGCAEFGGVVAEILSGCYQRLIFITYTMPGTEFGSTSPDGIRPYQQFFWDAYYKGFLIRDSAREVRLSELGREREEDHQFAELQREMQLDRCLHFHDLWTTIAYTHVSTACNSYVRSAKPRKAYRDPHKAYFSPEHRYQAAFHSEAMNWIRTIIDRNAEPKSRSGPKAFFTEQTYKQWFPDPFPQRTLFVLTPVSPYYLDQLEPAERSKCVGFFPVTAHALENTGFTIVDMRKPLSSVGDFIDHVHLSEVGGRRLAEEVAPQVRALALRLGYFKQGESR